MQAVSRSALVCVLLAPLALAASVSAQPVWGLVGSNSSISSEAFADDPFDADPPRQQMSSTNAWVPNFLGNQLGADDYSGVGILISSCPLIGVGHARIKLNGLGTPRLTIEWEIIAYTFHTCDRGGYTAYGLIDAAVDATVTAVNVPNGTPVTVDYAWGAISQHVIINEAAAEDDGYVQATQLTINGGNILGGGFDFASVPGYTRLADQRGVRPLIAGNPFNVGVGGECRSDINFPGRPGLPPLLDWGWAKFTGEIVLSLNGPPPAGAGGVGLPPGGLANTRLEFGVDLGGDRELGDANVDGDAAFDPGDAYLWHGAPIPPGGADGAKNDATAMLFIDPSPTPPNPPNLGPPYCSGNPPIVGPPVPWFDMDDHDTLSLDLRAILPPYPAVPASPIPAFNSPCVFDAEHLIVSFDDDDAAHWTNGFPGCSIPMSTASPRGFATFGTTALQDEVVGVELLSGLPAYFLVGTYPITDEVGLHTSMGPNPDATAADDDDVDSLDIFDSPTACTFWYFSADHEAAFDTLGGAFSSLDPGAIYLAQPGSAPIPIINPPTHLGLPPGVDIDAFEFVWLLNPATQTRALGLVFSVADDDPLTGNDESGGRDSAELYQSFLTGFSIPLVNGALQDDIDAITAYRTTLQGTSPTPCVICQPGSIPENEPCGADLNGGCDTPPLQFGSIAPGQTICGTTWADNATQDTDWYECTTTQNKTLTVCILSEVPVVVELYNNICGSPFLNRTQVAACTQACFSVAAPPGTYRIRVYPGTIAGGPITSGYPCAYNRFYNLTLASTPIIAPCPGDANGDRRVDAADLSVLLSQFGQFVVPCTGADFNCDGIVNAADLSVLLANFGAICP